VDPPGTLLLLDVLNWRNALVRSTEVMVLATVPLLGTATVADCTLFTVDCTQPDTPKVLPPIERRALNIAYPPVDAAARLSTMAIVTYSRLCRERDHRAGSRGSLKGGTGPLPVDRPG
jgi:hypothetical protein